MERWLSGRRHTLGKRAMRKRIRGFESPSLRQTESRLNPRLCYFCIKGVAKIIVNTEVDMPQWYNLYITQKSDDYGNHTK